MGHRPHFSLKELIGTYPNDMSKRTIEKKTAQSILKSLTWSKCFGSKENKDNWDFKDVWDGMTEERRVGGRARIVENEEYKHVERGCHMLSC